VLHALPDSCSVRVACPLPPLNLWESRWGPAPLPWSWGQLGSLGLGQPETTGGRKEPAAGWSYLWCLHQKQAVAAAWSGNRHGAGAWCLQCLKHHSPAVPWGLLAHHVWVEFCSASSASCPSCLAWTFQQALRVVFLEQRRVFVLLGLVFLPLLDTGMLYPSSLECQREGEEI